MEPYAHRRIRCHGVRELSGYRLKDYSIVYGAGSVDWLDFARGFELVLGELPRPAVAGGRPGVGFRIAHQGKTGRYAVLAWWDRENELPIRIAVRREGEGWRPAQGNESICVWDLQVIAFERDAYVATLLSGEAGVDLVARYLDLRTSGV
jgi:hypothetical protein